MQRLEDDAGPSRPEFCAEGCDSHLQKDNVVPILCSCSGLRVNSQHLCVELRQRHKLGPLFFRDQELMYSCMAPLLGAVLCSIPKVVTYGRVRSNSPPLQIVVHLTNTADPRS